MSRLKKKYQEEIRPKLQEKFGYKNTMLVPRLEKVVINIGVRDADKGVMAEHQKELALISGQQPIVTRARKSVAGFKLREGSPIGLMVTLRGTRMYDFVDRFLNIDCPRIRDFRGFKKRADGSGNYSVGIETQEIFHCLNLDEVKRAQGLQVTFVTTAKSDDECLEFLDQMGVPFSSEDPSSAPAKPKKKGRGKGPVKR